MNKNRKRLFASLLMVLLLCGLAACSKKPVVATGDNQGWIFASDSANSKGALSDQGYYFGTMSHLLSFGDLAAGKSTPLCTNVGCFHNGENCEAFVSGIYMSPIFFHNDHLYYIYEDYYGIHLIRRNNIGADMMKIADLGTKYVKEKASIEVRYYVTVANYLYYCAAVEKTVQNEESGLNITRRERMYIARINLSSGKEEILVDEIMETGTEQLILCAAQEDGVLFFHKSGVDKDVNDPAYADALLKMTVTLKCWNGEANEAITLFQKAREECSEIQMVADGKAYYTTLTMAGSNKRGNIYTYDLSTGKEELVCEETTFLYIGGGYALRRTEAIEGYWIYDLRKDETLPNILIELSTTVPQVGCMSDKGVVLQWVCADEDSGQKVRNFSYVTYESLADGLQEADLVTLYTLFYS